jgi:hypothetical protein
MTERDETTDQYDRGTEKEPLQLGHLKGAILRYKDADGEWVEVHFDE